MKIQERITTLIEEIKDDNTTSLWRVCRGIVENVSQHNKQIIAQMRDYDTHDKEHSEKVLEIIEHTTRCQAPLNFHKQINTF